MTALFVLVGIPLLGYFTIRYFVDKLFDYHAKPGKVIQFRHIGNREHVKRSKDRE